MESCTGMTKMTKMPKENAKKISRSPVASVPDSGTAENFWGIPQRDQLSEEDRQFVVGILAEMLLLDYHESQGVSGHSVKEGTRVNHPEDQQQDATKVRRHPRVGVDRKAQRMDTSRRPQ